MRVRSLEALELITYLQSFSTLINDDYAALPQLFTDERTLAEAAVSVGCETYSSIACNHVGLCPRL